MKINYNKQKGITLLSTVFVIAVIIAVFLFVVKIYPLYHEYFSVKAAMTSVSNQELIGKRSASDVRKYFLRNIEISGDFPRFTDNSVKKLVKVKRSKKGNKKFINVKYEAENKLFKNIYLHMKVDELVELPGGS